MRTEMDEEDKGILPLPVQDMVRHMRRSFGSSARSGHKYDVCPLTSRDDTVASQKARSALTARVDTSAQRLSHPLHKQSLQKLTRPTKMDSVVPAGSSSVVNVARQPVRFHDKTRCALVRVYSSSKFSRTDLTSASENRGQGDRKRRSSTTLVQVNSGSTSHQTAADCMPVEFSLAANLQHDKSVTIKQLTSNPALMELEPAISQRAVMKPSDSRCHNSKEDFICHAASECSNGTDIRYMLSEAGYAVAASPQTWEPVDSATVSTNVCQKQTPLAHILKDLESFRTHFPQRASQPQIGIAAVIKSTVDPRQDKAAQGTMIKFQSLEPLKLVGVTSAPLELESDDFSCTKAGRVPLQMRTSSNQIEPLSSSSVAEWAHVRISQTETPNPVSLEESTDEKWKEVKNFLRIPEYETPVKRRKRADSCSSGHMSDDDCCVDDDVSSSFGDKDDDSDDDYSDIDADLADIKPSECESLVALGKKQKQYFWQYNIQAKGPKGSRLKLAVESPSDPHVLNDFEDPVFDQCNTAIAGIRHGGKARKGDGNEITPNPKKLFMIGHQLLRLSHQINACQLGTDVPLVKRNEARKEKNKLASRACRLKKKAQHEANKIKLYGLEQEHCQLNSVLQFIWPHIHEKAKSLLANIDKPAPLTHLLEAQISRNLKSMIAGHTVDYVNSVILKVESGDYSGGLNIKRSHKA